MESQSEDTAPSREAAGDEGSSQSEDSAGGLSVSTDESGRKWLTSEIPYDVFPDLPTAEELRASKGDAASSPVDVASNMSEASGKETDGPSDATENAMAGEGEDAGEEAGTSDSVASLGTESALPAEGDEAGAGDGWGALLPVEVLEDEISGVNNRLGRNLLTVANYNSAVETVRRDGWEMSALATIASEHPGSLTWKPNALLVREAAAALARAAGAAGREDFQKAELAAEQVAAILNNNVPAGMDAPASDAPRDETADRAALMSRIQVARDRLNELATGESALRDHQSEINREARVVAALAKFVSDSDYDDAENPEYQSLAGDLIEAARSMARANEEEDFAAYESALNRAGMTCAACHRRFR